MPYFFVNSMETHGCSPYIYKWNSRGIENISHPYSYRSTKSLRYKQMRIPQAELSLAHKQKILHCVSHRCIRNFVAGAVLENYF